MIDEDLAGFMADFGILVEFKRTVEESSSSSSSSSGGSSSSSSAVESSSSSTVTEEIVVTTTLIFDAPPFEVNAYDRSFYDEKFYEASVRTEKPTLLGVEAELTNLRQNDFADINSVRWYVVGRSPDGTGLLQVVLSQTPVQEPV